MFSIRQQLNNKGSLLVEAALIIPIVMLVIAAVLYILLNLYNLTCLQSASNITCERGSYFVGENIKAIDMNSYHKGLVDSCRGQQEMIKRSMSQWINAFNLSCQKTDVKILPAFGFKQVHLKAFGIYERSSLAFIGKTFLKQKHLTTYYVHDEAEYIRNIDLMKDTAYAVYDNVFEESEKRYKTLQKE